MCDIITVKKIKVFIDFVDFITDYITKPCHNIDITRSP